MSKPSGNNGSLMTEPGPGNEATARELVEHAKEIADSLVSAANAPLDMVRVDGLRDDLVRISDRLRKEIPEEPWAESVQDLEDLQVNEMTEHELLTRKALFEDGAIELRGPISAQEWDDGITIMFSKAHAEFGRG